MDSRYLLRLARGHRIEVNGEATYAAAGRWTADPARRAKWRTLERLETQTKERLVDALDRAGMPVRERALDVRLGAIPARSSRCSPGVSCCVASHWSPAMRSVSGNGWNASVRPQTPHFSPA